jgi:acyl-CoA thioesterase-2
VLLSEMLSLALFGSDTYVGTGPRYTWGGLYGGQIVAQAFRAAAFTVEPEFAPHSLRAYFIRPGEHTEPIRFEVDRIRNGRSFITRRVVARQAIGAILNLEASFQIAESGADIETITMPSVPAPDDLPGDSWSEAFERVTVPTSAIGGPPTAGAGRSTAWMRANGELGDDELVHRCALAYISDDLPTESVMAALPGVTPTRENHEQFFGASLDHSIWFHRPVHADLWHLHDFTCHSYCGGRGLSLGHVFSADGAHVATVAQEVLVRPRRPDA